MDRHPLEASTKEVLSRNQTMKTLKEIDATDGPASPPAIGINGKYLKYLILGWLLQNAPQLAEGMLMVDANSESEMDLQYLRSRQLVHYAFIITYTSMVMA